MADPSIDHIFLYGVGQRGDVLHGYSIFILLNLNE